MHRHGHWSATESESDHSILVLLFGIFSGLVVLSIMIERLSQAKRLGGQDAIAVNMTF